MPLEDRLWLPCVQTGCGPLSVTELPQAGLFPHSSCDPCWPSFSATAPCHSSCISELSSMPYQIGAKMPHSRILACVTVMPAGAGKMLEENSPVSFPVQIVGRVLLSVRSWSSAVRLTDSAFPKGPTVWDSQVRNSFYLHSHN